MNELIENIRLSVPNLSLAQKRVAIYILEHYREIPFMSVTALAGNIGVSDTTVINFCVKMGFNGFMDFKMVFSKSLQSEVTRVNRLEKQLHNKSEDDFMSQVLECDINNLQSTLDNAHNHQNFFNFVGQIKQAQNVYVMGFRTSAVLAQYTVLRLRQLNINTIEIIPHLGAYADILTMLRKNDLFIAIAFTRCSKATYKSIQYAKEKGVPTALITDSLINPCCSYADTSLICTTHTVGHGLSYVGVFSLINAVSAAISSDKTNNVKEHLEKLEELLSTFDTYSKL